MTDTLTPPLAVTRRTYSVLGVELSRETLSLVALALCAGIVLGARLQRTGAKMHGCEECERTRLANEAAIRRGADDFETLRRESAAKRARADGGGVPGGSEVVSATPPAPSPNVSDNMRTGRPPIEPVGGDVIETEDGAAFPFIPPPPGSAQAMMDEAIAADPNPFEEPEPSAPRD